MSEHKIADDLESPVAPTPKASFWLRELPYLVVLCLTLIGIAYTSLSRQPIVTYWEFMALIIGIAVVSTAWVGVEGKRARFRLILTQGLHWISFLIAMNLALLPGVQRLLNPEATGLTVLLLLALGTVTAGITILSWQICFIGVVMALAVPGIAWLQQSALVIVLGSVVALIGVGIVYSWHKSAQRGEALPEPEKG